ncbi:FT-interacting protein 4-like [Dioscorea cayenensis subsp. rotundata]|uniref:FT-interacting protein 4-like n=1 Tax=Dioscorea cayennensis subsp. rotundata TaxID=55577 RepID=A0AB40AZL4_DIOCR|nr:FT-interacting protein 4-like [Dioscorea cayenensis subsp. rotundata]
MKLAVNVIEASDLMPKDKHGSSSPFVEVYFDNQHHRTQTIPKNLNPSWQETLLFNISDPSNLSNHSIDVSVHHHGHHRDYFLGRVRISASSISPSLSSTNAPVLRYPLEKRGLFSHIRGDIALRLYVLAADHETKFEEGDGGAPKVKEQRVFYSVGREEQRQHGNGKQVEQHGVTVMRMQAPMARPQAEFGLVETRPPLAARLGYHGRDKIASTYDLVEQMHYLYVNVVKARDLPAMDITGSLDPYVEVKLGNYKGITKHIEKNQSPVWHQVFAFSKERLQADKVEVLVKDKDVGKDDFVGRVVFDLNEVPMRVPPDSPLAPQWYRLEDRAGDHKRNRGEIMLAVWMGTQADEAFPDAWHSDAHSISLDGLAHTRSKVYFSPKLYYLRVLAIEAQDLVPFDKGRVPDVCLRIQLGNQLRRTRPASTGRSLNPAWNEEFLFVVAEPFDEPIVFTVEDHVGPNKDEPLGRLVLPVHAAAPRTDKLVDTKWFNLVKSSSGDAEKETKFSSKIHLRLSLDIGYHVLDESTHYSSDLQPSSRFLRKPSIGMLELGILSAKNLMPMKSKDELLTDAYCVVKYGPKWVRTRTILNSLAPRWNEQYTWEVFDPCTVITVAVFDNCHVHGSNNAKDQRIGKVRIRLSTLETDRIYTHYYPLLVLQPSGLKKTGELHMAVRFTCTAWVNMVTLYSKPLLPKMHYLQPIPVLQADYLRHNAMQIVAARLARAEPPLQRESVEYMLDVDSHMWSLRRSKANFYRITSLLSGFAAIGKWFDALRYWKNPMTTILVHILFLILVCYPELILPTIFLYLFMIGIWNYRYRPRHPPHMDTKLSHAEWTNLDELDEEFDTFPTSRNPDIVRARYDRLRSVAGRVQTVVGDMATQGERAQALLSWRDPRATGIFIMVALACALFLYVAPFQIVAMLAGLYLLRHPKFRTKMPSVPFNFYRRLPAKSDMLL